MIKLIAVSITAISISACGFDKIAEPDKPSAFQENIQRIALLTTPEKPEVATAVDVEPVVEVKPPPECTDHVFRIYRCVDGKITDWSHQP